MHKPFKFQEGVLNPSISADGPFIMIISDMVTAQLYLINCDTWAKIIPRYLAKVIFGIWISVKWEECLINLNINRNMVPAIASMRICSTLVLQAGDYVFLSTQRSVFPLLTFTKPSSFAHLLCVNRVKKSYISKPINLLDSLVICVVLWIYIIANCYHTDGKNCLCRAKTRYIFITKVFY